MAFKPFKSDIASTTPFVYPIQKDGELYSVGELLKFMEDGWTVTAASGTDQPDLLCQQNAVGMKGKMLASYRIPATMVFETYASEALTDIKEGDKLNLSADGLGVTAAKGGAARVVFKLGDEAGSKVYVRFS